jgi:hypothetical protein
MQPRPGDRTLHTHIQEARIERTKPEVAQDRRMMVNLSSDFFNFDPERVRLSIYRVPAGIAPVKSE